VRGIDANRGRMIGRVLRFLWKYIQLVKELKMEYIKRTWLIPKDAESQMIQEKNEIY